LIDQLGGTPVYNSMTDASAYQWSYSFEGGTGANALGNTITMSNGGGPLSDVVVAMTNFNASSAPLSLTLNIYNPGTYSSGPGSSPGSLIATDTQSFNPPAAPDGGFGSSACIAQRVTNPDSECGLANFNVTFNFSSQNITLPATVVYGIQYPNPQPVDDSGVNVQLSYEASQVSIGSDASPGYLYVSTYNGSNDATGGSGGEITCDTVNGTFGEYPTAADPTTGCGETTDQSAPFTSTALIPAVEFDSSTAGDLFPGGPPEPINFSMTNTGTDPETVTDVTIALANDGSGLVQTGNPASDVAGCDVGWFTVSPTPVVVNYTIAAGATVDWVGQAHISMPADATDNQDSCEGVPINLTFTSN
jgi:hypothetical protein